MKFQSKEELWKYLLEHEVIEIMDENGQSIYCLYTEFEDFIIQNKAPINITKDLAKKINDIAKQIDKEQIYPHTFTSSPGSIEQKLRDLTTINDINLVENEQLIIETIEGYVKKVREILKTTDSTPKKIINYILDEKGDSSLIAELGIYSSQDFTQRI